MLYGRFATSLVGAGCERGKVELERVAEGQVDIGGGLELGAQTRLERAIDLDRVDTRDPIGEQSA